MKKYILLLLAFIMCFSLAACSNDSLDEAMLAEIDEKLFGVWELNQKSPEGFVIDSTYVFAQGEVACIANISGFEKTTTGTYQIGKDIITVKYDEERQFELNYKYTDGILQITLDGTELTQINGANWNK